MKLYLINPPKQGPDWFILYQRNEITGVMMKYDFNQIISRQNTDCIKWDAAETIFGSNEVIPLWIADMDFPAARPIVEALKKRVEHKFYGYTQPGDTLRKVVVDRLQREFGWRIQPDWIVFTPGVLPAISVAIRSLTHPGDGVIIQEPVYHPFFPIIKQSGCQIVSNALQLKNGRYEMDFTDLESNFHHNLSFGDAENHVKAMILCNPHNPVGRVWDEESLTRLGEIAIGRGITIVSDEIHCEILYKGYKHTVFASISHEFEQNCIVCMSPSKTFNLAGLAAASIIIPNKQLRDNFNDIKRSIVYEPNLFGLIAMEAAYQYGDEWLDELRDYLQGNLDFTLDYFNENIPKIKAVEPQGTYLIWLDCRSLGLENASLRDLMRIKAKVGLDDGFLFGVGGSGFQRMNIACPRSVLEEALGRIETTVNSL